MLWMAVRRGKNLIACSPHFSGSERMGAKYLPTIKDQRANQRFQQKQNPLRKFKKSTEGGAGKKGKRK